MRLSYAGGGKIKGPGTGTSDSVHIDASKGEYMMPADSVKKIGVRALDALRKATHTPVKKPKGGAVRHMADGGLVVDDPNSDAKLHPSVETRIPVAAAPAAPAPAQTGGATGAWTPAAQALAAPAAAPPAADAVPSYGEQMSKVGGAIADMAGSAAKTLVSAPGYGFNSPSMPWNSKAAPAAAAVTPVAANAQDAHIANNTLASPPIQPSAAAPAAVQALAAPAPAAPAGPVARIAKTVTQAGNGYWAGTTGDDLIGDRTQAGFTWVDAAPTAKAGKSTTWTSAPGGAARSMAELGSPNWPTGGQPVPLSPTQAREARMANGGGTAADAIAMGIEQQQAYTDRLLAAAGNGSAAGFANRAHAIASLAGQNNFAQLQGTAATAAGQHDIEQQRLAQQGPEVKARTAELSAQARLREGTSTAQQALLAAKTPEERQTAEENLRATLGKDHIVRGIPVSLPADEHGVPQGGAVWDDRTQQFRYPEAQRKEAPTPAPGHIAALKADPKLAAQFDARYGKGAAAKYLGAQ